MGLILQGDAISADLSIWGIEVGAALQVLVTAFIGFGAMLVLIGLEAGFLSGEFSRQAGWSSGKWTTENIEAFRQEELGTVKFMNNVFGLVSVWLNAAANLTHGASRVIAIGAEIGGLVGMLAQYKFASIINDTINQEEAVLDPNTVVPCDITPECH